MCSVAGRGLLLVAAAAAALLALAFRFGNADTWWVELVRYVPYPAWLAPALLAFLLSWAFGWRWRLLGTATLALVVGPVMGLSLGLDRTEPLEAGLHQPLRVMTYNVKTYRAEDRDDGYERLADEIRHAAPDLLLLQDGPHLNRPGRLDPVMREALRPYQWQGFGQYVIASRYPMQDCRVGNLSRAGAPAWPYLRCTVTVGTRQVTVVNVHTLTPREGLNATRSERLEGLGDWRENFAVRMAQARKLADDVALLPRPLIVAGDLNATQASPVVQTLLAEGLRDAYGTAGRGWGFTVGHALRPHLSFLRIDHVLVSAELGITDARVGSRWASEHRPVVADLLVPGDAAPAP